MTEHEKELLEARREGVRKALHCIFGWSIDDSASRRARELFPDPPERRVEKAWFSDYRLAEDGSGLETRDEEGEWSRCRYTREGLERKLANHERAARNYATLLSLFDKPNVGDV